MFEGKDYSPTELLDTCTVDRFFPHDTANNYVLSIFAVFATEKDPDQAVKKIEAIVRQIGQVSIGHALERLADVATFGPDEFHGGVDGIDALAYHLCGTQCTKAIDALNAVLLRFKIDEERKAAEHAQWVAKNIVGGNGP